jgi:hypothetical protein
MKYVAKDHRAADAWWDHLIKQGANDTRIDLYPLLCLASTLTDCNSNRPQGVDTRWGWLHEALDRRIRGEDQ